MIVLGVDPGTANTGYGVVALNGTRLIALDGGVVTTSAGSSPEERLKEIHDAISGIIAEHSPASVALEDLYFGRNVSSAIAVGQARGAVMVASAQAGLRCTSYSPPQVKSAVCGNGRADKEQVQHMVQRLLSLERPPRPDHAADALAVAICHMNASPLAAASAG